MGANHVANSQDDLLAGDCFGSNGGTCDEVIPGGDHNEQPLVDSSAVSVHRGLSKWA
jgi:hypothetical protein